jgi:hypothetical protein
MARGPLARDTHPEAGRRLVAAWQSMGIAQRAELIRQMCADVERLARADIRARHPSASELEVARELARRRYGTALADAAYADVRPGE